MKQASLGAGELSSCFTDCNFNGSAMTLPVGGNARFVNCTFRDVTIKDWFCFTVELINCQFSGEIHRAWFNATVPEKQVGVAGRRLNEFYGNDFSECELIDVGFRTGIDLTLQRFPTGSQYLVVHSPELAVASARSSVSAMADMDLRRQCSTLLDVLENRVLEGQRQLFLRELDYGLKAPHAAAVFALLRRFEQLSS